VAGKQVASQAGMRLDGWQAGSQSVRQAAGWLASRYPVKQACGWVAGKQAASQVRSQISQNFVIIYDFSRNFLFSQQKFRFNPNSNIFPIYIGKFHIKTFHHVVLFYHVCEHFCSKLQYMLYPKCRKKKNCGNREKLANALAGQYCSKTM
jgi:hypothetical protein